MADTNELLASAESRAITTSRNQKFIPRVRQLYAEVNLDRYKNLVRQYELTNESLNVLRREQLRAADGQLGEAQRDALNNGVATARTPTALALAQGFLVDQDSQSRARQANASALDTYIASRGSQIKEQIALELKEKQLEQANEIGRINQQNAIVDDQRAEQRFELERSEFEAQVANRALTRRNRNTGGGTSTTGTGLIDFSGASASTNTGGPTPEVVNDEQAREVLPAVPQVLSLGEDTVPTTTGSPASPATANSRPDPEFVRNFASNFGSSDLSRALETPQVNLLTAADNVGKRITTGIRNAVSPIRNEFNQVTGEQRQPNLSESQTIDPLANARTIRGALPLARTADDEDDLDRLIDIPGIGVLPARDILALDAGLKNLDFDEIQTRFGR